MSGRNVSITFVVQAYDLEESREIVARARAAWHESGNKEAEVYVNDPFEPNTGPWD